MRLPAMKAEFAIVRLSEGHLTANLDAYLTVSADVSPWTAENFLKRLPCKWDLSFALWQERPIAYCIMSLREGAVHIHQFMVAKDYRGKSVGSAMMLEAKTIAATKSNRITLKVPRHNVEAQRFYQRHGFSFSADAGDYRLLTFEMSRNQAGGS